MKRKCPYYYYYYYINIHAKINNDQILTKKDFKENIDFSIQKLPFANFNDLWGHTLFHEKIYVFLMFINECARKKA